MAVLAQDLPLTNSPEVFGLHSNAEIGYFVDNARRLWYGLLQINIATTSGTTDDDTEASATKEQALVNTATGILEKLPKKGFFVPLEDDVPTPTQVVLLQVICPRGNTPKVMQTPV